MTGWSWMRGQPTLGKGVRTVGFRVWVPWSSSLTCSFPRATMSRSIVKTHAFVISEQRQQRNALALTFSRAELACLSCCSRGAARQIMVPCLNTLAMGDSHAVNFGQTSHLAVVLRQGALRLRDFVTLKGRPPRSPALVCRTPDR